jgi:hypothetical protein
VLERLTPEERAAFLLREVFESGYSEIAQVLGKSEVACRQIASRARRLRVFSVISIRTDGTRILDVFTVLNPDKLPRQLRIERGRSTPAQQETK